MELLVSILASLIIALSPQVSEAPTSSPSFEIGMEVGEDGCPLEEPCFDYEAEKISDVYAAFGYDAVEEALNIVDNLEAPSSGIESTLAYEYVATFNGGTPEFDETHFTIASPTHPGVEHVIHVATHWIA